MKNIEVEVRVLLDEQTRLALLAFLSEHAKKEGEKERMFIDYSTFLEGIGERKMDIRTRVTNGKVELIVKKGSFGSGSRIETSIFVADNKLKDALTFMAALGYKKGVLGVRKIQTYQYEDIEVAFQEVVDCDGANIKSNLWGSFAELEIMTTEDGKEDALRKIQELLKSLGLTMFTDKDWFSYVEKMNIEANGVFDFDSDLALLCEQVETK